MRETNIKVPQTISTPTNTFTDSRDGQVYQTIKLKDGKIWMAQNMNFDVGEGCWFYENKPDNGKKFGRLYTWEAAKKACPKGWHIPSDDKWWEMASHYGSAGNQDSGKPKNTGNDAGKSAYAALTVPGNSGFHATLGGGYNLNSEFDLLDDMGTYWTATHQNTYETVFYYFYRYYKSIGRYSGSKKVGRSCRYVQN